MPSSSLFLTKYIFRALHMGAFAIFFGNYLLDYLFGKREVTSEFSKKYSIIFHSSTVILLVSGLINMIILVKENKFVKNTAYKIWKNILIGKFCLTLALTPLLEKIIPVKDVANPHLVHMRIRIFLMIVMFLISPFARFYRESYLIKGVTYGESKDEKIHAQ